MQLTHNGPMAGGERDSPWPRALAQRARGPGSADSSGR